IGAFIANVTAHETVAAASGIAVGNTLDAMVGARLLHGIPGFRPSLARVADVSGLLVRAGLVSTALSATLGTTSLCLAGVQPWSAFGPIWSVWWLGDAMGDVVVAPVLLVWATESWRRWTRRRLAELGGLLAALVGTAVVLFAERWLT